MSAPENELRRGFGLSTATYMVIASMVGTGILVSPGYMMASLGNWPVILGLWILGGVLAMCGALCIAELATALPRAGGEYVYLREAYGPVPAFLSGWTSFFLGFSAPLAVVGHIAATYLSTPLGWAEGDLRVRIMAAILIVLLTVPNLLGHRRTAWIQSLTTIVKLGLFAALVIAGFLFGEGRMARLGEGAPMGGIDFGTATTQLFFVMFAYSGWTASSYLAGEVRDPRRVLPRSVILGSGVVIVLDLGLCLVFAYAVPLEGVGFDNAEHVPQMAVANMFGESVSDAFSVAVGLTFLATVSAFVVTGARIYYAMAKDGLFPAHAGRVSAKHRVPVPAMLAQSAFAIVLLFVTDFDNLYKYASVGLSLFAMLFIAAVYVLRVRRPDLERPFRVPGYPFVPGLFLAASAFMAVFAFREWPVPSMWSLASILAGIPVYYAWTFLRRKRIRR